MNVNTFVKTKTRKYPVGRKLKPNELVTIQVKVLHHLACIEVTVERSFVPLSKNGQIRTVYSSHLIRERFTLRYFQYFSLIHASIHYRY
jgi:hypothetical protein